MKRITLAAPFDCPRCGVEQPAGADMAVYEVGPKTLTRCVPCDVEIATTVARIEQERLARIRAVPADATAEEAAKIQAVEFGGQRRVKRLSELAASVRLAQQKAGDGK